MTLDETALALRAVEEPAAFGELYDHFFPRVFTYTRYRCDDDATADDLTAQVFERVLSRLHHFAPEKGPFAPWLFAVARNTVNDYWRRAKRRRWLPLDFARGAVSPEPDPESRVIACEEEQNLLTALGTLSARERDILGLKFAARLSNRDIAREMGMSDSNIGVIVYRAVGRLREYLTEKEA